MTILNNPTEIYPSKFIDESFDEPVNLFTSKIILYTRFNYFLLNILLNQTAVSSAICRVN